MIYDYNSWTPYDGFAEGSGRSEKLWLISDTGSIGLFKFTKSIYTTEHISERLSYLLAKHLGIEAAEVFLGKRDKRDGCLSMLVNMENEELIEGISYISKLWPNYDDQIMFDTETQEYYSIHHILDSTRDYVPGSVWIEMFFFDFLIGNTDRHQNNWALLTTADCSRVRRAPLYDNGSSLCCYVKEEDIPLLLGKDKNRFRALTDTKSRSIIRINPKSKKHPTHKEIVAYLLAVYPRIAFPLANKIVECLDKQAIDTVLSDVQPALSKQRLELIRKYLLEKITILQQLLINKE